MANPAFKDAVGNTKYLQGGAASGSGSDASPYITQNEVTQATHDNLNGNANLQVANADVGNANPVPVSDAGGSVTVDGPLTDAQLRASDVKISLDSEAVVLGAGSAAIGKLAANSGVDIGDVDITSIAAGDNNIGNVDLASAIPAGTNTIGATKDAGPSQTITRTYTTSADMSTAADITAAPSAGQKIVAMDILISVDTAMSFAVQMETTANVLAKVYLPANGSAQITLRGYLKGDAADKKLQGKASVAGNVAITAIYFSEA